MTATKSATKRMTGEEFLRDYLDRDGFELDCGTLVELPMPGLQHGEVCGNALMIFGNHIKSKKLGRIFSNDSLIRTRSEPDAFRGPDVMYISYETFARDLPTPKGTFTPPLELVVEVKSPFNTFKEMDEKATEYLNAGVKVVIVLDPETESASINRINELPLRMHNGDELTLPDILPGFSVPVKRFFE